MRSAFQNVLAVFLPCVIAILFLIVFSRDAGSQSVAPGYQVGTIMDVKLHQEKDTASPTKRYDVSVKVGDTLYMVLATPDPGSETIMYKAGLDFPVMVGSKTITFKDALSRTMSVPILSRKPLPKEKSE